MKDVNGCVTSIYIPVESSEIETPTINSGALEICKGEVTNLQALSSVVGGSYEWSPALGISNPYSNFVIAAPEETTTYTLKVTNEQQCSKSAEVTIVVNECNETISGLSSIQDSGIRLFPNPIINDLTVELPAVDSYQLSIYSLKGVRVMEQIIDNTQTLSLDYLNQGVYLLVLENEQEQYFTKVIKN